MAPVLDYHEYCTGGFDPDDIVISGIAGRFPECDNVGELKESLYSKKDLVVFRDDRFEKGAANMPYSSCGLVRNLDKFDTKMFNIPAAIAQKMDPGSRMHIEITYEAIADSGYNPVDLKKERIGIFNATITDDASRMNIGSHLNIYSSRSMTPNRTSYALDFTGTSLSMDSACSSSGIAFCMAVNSIRVGDVDAAIVSGCQLNLLPETAMGYVKLGVASTTGNSRPFDSKSDGMIRTEAVTALFLQKAKVARRAYAIVLAARSYAAGFNPDGIAVTSETILNKIIVETLREANVNRNDVEYIETHGTGTEVGDRQEVKALSDVFSENRDEPLLIGSIKSNIGHTEASSGICGVIKALLTFENNAIPPNIKYESPRTPALIEGKLKVVTEPTPFNANYIPVISIGFGGTLVNILLKKNPVMKGGEEKALDLPRLVLYPATVEEAITTLFDYIKNNPNLSGEFFALLNKLSYTDPSLKPFRGYALYQSGKKLESKMRAVPFTKRPVWFVMTGMGCQWSGMGLQLMKLDVFAESMLKSAAILKTYGIDLLEVLKGERNESKGSRDITSPLVAICSIQIALIDVLKLLCIIPDGMVGHSTGEIACAYADGCLTSEQAIKAAYFRGKAIDESNLPEGGMAAVGMGKALL
ncbi:fatty acid synthase [Nephila pilipes]|uniref:Fatty acid synthase n=1 Tax=Nephila pilipes TaxID=299642 RepID=A0A8X6TFQ1_NEPPI|nr:fatty acid synthase [Nephila pilipes]